MGVEKCILHPRRPKTASYGLTRRQKNPKHPKTLLNHSVRNGFWRPQVAARRSNTAPRPIWAAPTVGASSGACGRTTYAVIPPPPWHLGPDCGAFWPRASFLPLKSGAQSNQALVSNRSFDPLDAVYILNLVCVYTHTVPMTGRKLIHSARAARARGFP